VLLRQSSRERRGHGWQERSWVGPGLRSSHSSSRSRMGSTSPECFAHLLGQRARRSDTRVGVRTGVWPRRTAHIRVEATSAPRTAAMRRPTQPLSSQRSALEAEPAARIDSLRLGRLMPQLASLSNTLTASLSNPTPRLLSTATPRDASRRIDALALCLAVLDVAGGPRPRPAHVGLVRFQPWPPPSKTRRPRSPDNVRRDRLRGSRRGANAPVHICVDH
jgi:hypothetical protein